MTPPDDFIKVLVVDDMPEKLLVYQAILSELGLCLVTANSGEEALRAVLQNEFAVILLDVQMPGMNGLETATMIRRRRRSAHTPIIFLTAFADEMRATEGYAQGAVDYITTPVVPGVLRAKVRVFADLYRLTQQSRRQAEERIALVEERTKREAAEEANRWLDFIIRAGAILGQSLDREVTTRSVVQLPIPTLADLVVLVTLQPDGKPGRFTLARNTDEGLVVQESPSRPELSQELSDAIDRSLRGVPSQTNSGAGIAFQLRAREQTFAILGLSRQPFRPSFNSAELNVAETFVSRAASALENARLYHEVEEANRQKNEFLSMLAHELRNPLAPIRNANEILRQKGCEPNKVRWAQGVIDRQLTHLIRLVDDLLDVSRLTLGKIRLAKEPVSLDQVVAHAVEATRPLIDQLHHILDVSLPSNSLEIIGDPARLAQVLINLLTNAAKYSEPGGRISLTATRETGTAIIRIRDTGIGISADLLPRVFDLFTQASRSLDRSQGGLGIGLTLVRQLVEMHGGTVEAFSEGVGRGSEFVIRIPAIAGGSSNSTIDPIELPESLRMRGRLRVVVVDDNVDAAESVADLLGLLGHQLAVAHDGPTGFEVIREHNPDVVLLDIGLPGMNGYEIARRLRADTQPPLVLVAVSGYGGDADRQLAQEAGFDYYFVKPVQFDTLRKLLEEIENSGTSRGLMPRTG